MWRFIFLLIILFWIAVCTLEILDDVTDWHVSEYIKQRVKEKLPIKKK